MPVTETFSVEHEGGGVARGSVTITDATQATDGLMSAADKTSLDNLALGNVTTPIRNETGSAIAKDTLLAASGFNVSENRVLVVKADKDDPTKRPAIAITTSIVPNNSNADILVVGTLIGVDTSSFSMTDQLVLGNDGALSRPPPDVGGFTGEVQNVASVTRVDATDGRIVVSLDGLNPETADQIFAFAGTDGTPSNTNKFVTNSDPRNTDDRTPTAHDLGGAEHSADTLANLNAKVSDATLIDTGDARLSDDRTASGLRTASGIVVISGATAPTAGQILKATSGTAATWQPDVAFDLERFEPNMASLPSLNKPSLADRNDHPVLDYNDSSVESAFFNGVLSKDYSAGNIIVDLDWAATTATTGDVVWGVEFERLNAGGTDLDVDSFAAQQTGTSSTNAVSGIITRTTITFTQAQADSILAGESFRLRVQRVATAGGDTMVGDAELIRVYLRQ